jgi:hypothetical protein
MHVRGRSAELSYAHLLPMIYAYVANLCRFVGRWIVERARWSCRLLQSCYCCEKSLFRCYPMQLRGVALPNHYSFLWMRSLPNWDSWIIDQLPGSYYSYGDHCCLCQREDTCYSQVWGNRQTLKADSDKLLKLYPWWTKNQSFWICGSHRRCFPYFSIYIYLCMCGA